jgi:hypothetical protein
MNFRSRMVAAGSRVTVAAGKSPHGASSSFDEAGSHLERIFDGLQITSRASLTVLAPRVMLILFTLRTGGREPRRCDAARPRSVRPTPPGLC